MGPHLGGAKIQNPSQSQKIMIARFWGKTAIPHTTRQTDAIALDFFLPRPGWFYFTGREGALGEGRLWEDFKEYL
jgi:hypothetical protein